MSENNFSVGKADGPKSSGKGIMRVKVLGIPVIYILAVFVIAIALYAWKTKPTAEASDAASDDSEGGAADVSELYPIAPTGTVYAGQPQTQVVEDVPYFGNSEWMRKAVMGLASKSSKSPGAIQLALQAYLNGEHLTYEQALIRDEAIKEYGMPPDNFTAGTADGKPVPAPPPTPAPAPVVTPVAAPAPAPPNPVVERHVTPATITRTHRVVRGDTLWDLAQRYYGNPTQWRKISAANGNPNPRKLKIGRILVIPG